MKELGVIVSSSLSCLERAKSRAGKTLNTLFALKQNLGRTTLLNGKSRKRLKSAPYLRLKNSKSTSKCQENVMSNLSKRYIRTLKTFHSNFENVTSELSKWYIRCFKVIVKLSKSYTRTLKKLHPNFQNVTCEL